MAAELAKVSLWLEALDPGRPLSFLDAQIRVGNALLGTTPALLAEGIPDEAFKPIEGDDKKITATLAKQNKAERSAQGSLFDVDMVAANTKLAEQVEKVVAAPALSLDDVHVQEQRLRAYTESTAYRQQRLAADAWCAAFVWPKSLGAPPAVTQRTITTLIDGDDKLTDKQRAEIERLTAEYRFFHWHLEFPAHLPDRVHGRRHRQRRHRLVRRLLRRARQPAVGAGETSGTGVLRLPRSRDREGAERRGEETPDRGIAGRDPPRAPRAFVAEKRSAERRVSTSLRNSGRYPLCGRGDINTYAVFAETDRELLGGKGRLGVILPTGIATDATTQYFFKDLVDNALDRQPLRLRERASPSSRRCTAASSSACSPWPAGTCANRQPTSRSSPTTPPTSTDPDVRFALTPEEITLLNPNTGTCPIFRSRRDAEITLGIYRRVPVLIREGDPDGNPWGVKFMQGMFNMTNDSHLFRTRDELEADGWTLQRQCVLQGQEGDAAAVRREDGFTSID